MYQIKLLLIALSLIGSINAEITQQCLDCICEATSGCNLHSQCYNTGPDSYHCGPYGISWAYWADSGKPGFTGHSQDFEYCLTNKACADQAVVGYMSKYGSDCNGDGVVDCNDYAAIHQTGPGNCNAAWLATSDYWARYQQTSCGSGSLSPVASSGQPDRRRTGTSPRTHSRASQTLPSWSLVRHSNNTTHTRNVVRNGATSHTIPIGNRPFRGPVSSPLNANRRTSTSSVSRPFGVNPEVSNSGESDDYFDSFTTGGSSDSVDSSFGSSNLESHTSSFESNNRPLSRPSNRPFGTDARVSGVNGNRPGFGTSSRNGANIGFGNTHGFGSSSGFGSGSRFGGSSGNVRVGGGGGSFSTPIGSSHARPVFTPLSGPVDQYCLDCLCHAASKCDLNQHCSGSVCGPYLISWGYWADGGKLGGDYVTCSLDKSCSESTVQGYMNRWKQDCNGDGQIDCEDFALIHQLGPSSCSSRSITTTSFWKEFDSCLNPALDSRRKPAFDLLSSVPPQPLLLNSVGIPNNLTFESRTDYSSSADVIYRNPNDISSSSFRERNQTRTRSADSLNNVSNLLSSPNLNYGSSDNVVPFSIDFDKSFLIPDVNLTFPYLPPLNVFRFLSQPDISIPHATRVAKPLPVITSDTTRLVKPINFSSSIFTPIDTSSNSDSEIMTLLNDARFISSIFDKEFDHVDHRSLSVPSFSLINNTLNNGYVYSQPYNILRSASPATTLTTSSRTGPRIITASRVNSEPRPSSRLVTSIHVFDDSNGLANSRHSNSLRNVNPGNIIFPSDESPVSVTPPRAAEVTRSVSRLMAPSFREESANSNYHTRPLEQPRGRILRTEGRANNLVVNPHTPVVPSSWVRGRNDVINRNNEPVVRSVEQPSLAIIRYPTEAPVTNYPFEPISAPILPSVTVPNLVPVLGSIASPISSPVSSPRPNLISNPLSNARSSLISSPIPSPTPSPRPSPTPVVSRDEVSVRNVVTTPAPVPVVVNVQPVSAPAIPLTPLPVTRSEVTSPVFPTTPRVSVTRANVSNQGGPVSPVAVHNLPLPPSYQINRYTFKQNEHAANISDNCLKCICEASTKCDQSLGCSTTPGFGKVCGAYEISLEYWNIAGKPGYRGSAGDFEKCTSSLKCSEQTVKRYMSRIVHDCNGDNNIDCIDFAAVHKVGSGSCQTPLFLDSQYWNDFQRCYGFDKR